MNYLTWAQWLWNILRISSSPLFPRFHTLAPIFSISVSHFHVSILKVLKSPQIFFADYKSSTFFFYFSNKIAASSSVNKFSLCLDSAPLSVGESKNRGVDSSPLRSSNEDHSLVLDPNLTVQSSPPQSNMVLRKRIRKIKQGMKRYNSQLSLMRRDLRNCKAKIAEQQKQIIEYSSRLDDNDKKNEETSRKFSTLLQVFTKVYFVRKYFASKTNDFTRTPLYVLLISLSFSLILKKYIEYSFGF